MLSSFVQLLPFVCLLNKAVILENFNYLLVQKSRRLIVHIIPIDSVTKLMFHFHPV